MTNLLKFLGNWGQADTSLNDKPADFYVHNLTRYETERLLYVAAARAAAGVSVFLLRKSQSEQNDFVLSFYVEGGEIIHNYLIEPTINQSDRSQTFFTLDLEHEDGLAEPSFTSLNSLVEHYMTPQSRLKPPLGIFAEKNTMLLDNDCSIKVDVDILDQGVAAPTRLTRLHPKLEPIPIDQQVSGDEVLLAEGYLIRSSGQTKNKRTFFRLTTLKMAFFTSNAEDTLGFVDVANIAAISDIGKTKIRIITEAPAGMLSNFRSNEMLIEAPNPKIKQRWFSQFSRVAKDSTSSLHSSEGDGMSKLIDGEKLLVEGYMVKVKPIGTANTKRWFTFTNRYFSYYKEEAGELMGSLPLEKIMSITCNADCEFIVRGSERFTRTGQMEIICRCESYAVRNKWLSQMMRMKECDFIWEK